MEIDKTKPLVGEFTDYYIIMVTIGESLINKVLPWRDPPVSHPKKLQP